MPAKNGGRGWELLEPLDIPLPEADVPPLSLTPPVILGDSLSGPRFPYL